ncbi:MAG: dienelactone hydrolase family protein [Myxococcota bacterium]
MRVHPILRPVLSALVLLLATASAEAAVKTKEVTYTHDGVKLKGFMAWDDAQKGKRPGVLVVHEWWGHNDYARSRAQALAKMGYTALALDMYGDGKQASHPEDAGKFATSVLSNMDLAKGRFMAAQATLAKHPTVNGDKIAAIGYCFGGSVVLTMARLGLDLDAVASFHGGLQLPPRTAETVEARVMVAHGGADPFVKKEQITAFVGDMVEAKADLTFYSYAGVVHSFTNPGADAFGKKFSLPLKYDEDADKKSWQALGRFLEQTF